MESYTYDNYGRALSTTKAIDDLGSVTFSNSYNGFGNVDSITYPKGVVVTKSYDSYGYLLNTTLKNGTSDAQSIWTLNELSASAMKYTLGNGFITEKSFNNYGMVTSIKSSYGATCAQDMSYEFNVKNGLLNNRSDNRYNLKESFTYDKIERLTKWDVINSKTSAITSSNSLGYANDRVTNKSDIGSYYYGGSKPHAVSSVLAAVGYAPNDKQTLTYNNNGKVATIAEGDNNLAITYGYDDQRVKTILTQNGVATTTYFAGQYEVKKLADGTIKEYFYINGGDGLAAVLIKTNGDAGELLYVHKDHLGSITALTDNNADATKAIREQMSYDPWGRRRNPADWSFNNVPTLTLLTRGYTGHEHLDAFNLINMNGRIYDPQLGMFISLDNFVQNPTASQNFNRYTYCMGNPLKSIDPSGYEYEMPSYAVPDYSSYSSSYSYNYTYSNYVNEYNYSYSSGGGYGTSGGVGISYGNYSASATYSMDYSYGNYSYAYPSGNYTIYGSGGYFNDSASFSGQVSDGVNSAGYSYNVANSYSWSCEYAVPNFKAITSQENDMLRASVESEKHYTYTDGQVGVTDNTGIRAPDFYSLNVTIAIPNNLTGTSVGWSANISIDRYAQVYISPIGLSFGKSAFDYFSASLTTNWMSQSTMPTANETYDFLSGHGISSGGGFVGGVNWGVSPFNSGTKNAIGFGFYTPQIGTSYNYTPDSIFGYPLIFNRN